jgi:hypothetical protein
MEEHRGEEVTCQVSRKKGLQRRGAIGMRSGKMSRR